MHFSRLKLNGFKSFVDPTELLIEPGLTGIVGPNGCGKSNLVEALRWVMGENSAKQIRGNEMDDVIFSGTSSRPARNNAAVELHLENPDRDAPAAYNDGKPLTVSRHIQRGLGSAYRINSGEVRAKDLQLLFADASTGARSTAIVSQGQVGAVINAKPEKRRHLLEEAAGITGLRSRRHEAELRLRAAEGNVERLNDVVVALQEQLQNLKRQARQASRYRSLSGRIRKAEAMLLYSRWLASDVEVKETSRELSEIARIVLERSRKSAKMATSQAEAAGALPELREGESKAAVQVQRLVVEVERLDDEAKRLEDLGQSLTDQISVVVSDIEREKKLQGDATTRITDLTAETDILLSQTSDELNVKNEFDMRVAGARRKVDDQEARVAALTEHVAAANISRAGLEQKYSEIEERLNRLRSQSTETKQEESSLQELCKKLENLADPTQVEGLRNQADLLRKVLEETVRSRTYTEQELEVVRSKEFETRQTLMDAVAEKTQLAAELKALSEIANKSANLTLDGQGQPTLFEKLKIKDGYVAALAAALGDDLCATLDGNSPISWRQLKLQHPVPEMIKGVRPLSECVVGPEVLSVRLSQIGVVDSFEEGQTKASQLNYGQRLVTAAGDLWRWDGYFVRASALPNKTSEMRRRDRINQLANLLDKANAIHQSSVQDHLFAKKSFDDTRIKAEELRRSELELRTKSLSADDALAERREEIASTVESLANHRARLEILKTFASRIQIDQRSAEDDLQLVEKEIAELPSSTRETELLGEARSSLVQLRQHLEGELRSQEKVNQEQEARSDRLVSIQKELSLWKERDAGAGLQVDSLISRHRDLNERYEAIRVQPEQLKSRRLALIGSTTEAEKRRKMAADKLVEAEFYLNKSEDELRQANNALAESREAKARIEGKRDQAVALQAVEVQQIQERLGCEPEGALELAELTSSDQLPELGAVERQMDRLHRERENMGSVNLRAEEESSELSVQIETLETERTDLISAISRLRNGIATLNREGRQRLREAFEEVNRHFEVLFVRLFGGGRAKLALVGNDDPLEAGLEIMASPPGKRLQSLSLLSGGEKALAALSLLFAVFLTKPAPICVLDEVDAPLDDSNVERFCSLVHEIAGHRRTRFLVVTHHRLTMARMDRLFGVTMSEHGVSQLVSVDLNGMSQLRAAE